MVRSTQELWNSPSYWSEPAERAFAAVRRKARRQIRADRLRGRRSTLVPFDEVISNSGALPESHERLEDVPLDKIVGSVGKARHFTSAFHPATDAMLRRWKRAYAFAHGLRGYEPVELYEVNGDYFVVDGHYRVSVAKALGSDRVQATVRRWTSTSTAVQAA